MEGMTMTASPPARPKHGGAWTIEDLVELPADDDRRYEIHDGSLLVVPYPDTVLTLDGGDREYVESAVVRPGQRWRTDQPFPLTFDLGEVF